MSSSSSSFTICVAGDPIDDIYQMGIYEPTRDPPRFTVQESMRKDGGAANVSANLRGFTRADETTQVHELFSRGGYWSGLERLVNISTSKTLMEIKTTPGDDLLDPWTIIEDEDHLYEGIPYGRSGLIIADYNKGHANKPLPKNRAFELARRGQFEFIIVDSRYGTYWPGWLNYSRMKILHATGEELDRHNPLLFKYVLHTNGPGAIRILRHGVHLATIPVPAVEAVVDPTGAGDTFVASVAAALATNCNQAWDDQFIIQAVEQAIPRCQQVLAHLGVHVPEE